MDLISSMIMGMRLKETTNDGLENLKNNNTEVKMQFPSREIVEDLRKRYPKGTSVNTGPRATAARSFSHVSPEF